MQRCRGASGKLETGMSSQLQGRITSLGVAVLATIGAIWALNVAQSIIVPLVVGLLLAFLMMAEC